MNVIMMIAVNLKYLYKIGKKFRIKNHQLFGFEKIKLFWNKIKIFGL